YDATLQDKDRTNNTCEEWNYGIQKLVGHAHPGFWRLIEWLQQDQALFATALTQARRVSAVAVRLTAPSRRRAMDLSDLTSLELQILERTADMGAISYDSTPMRDVDERSAAGTDCGHCGDDERPRRGEASSQGSQELEDAPDDGTGRLGNTDWCQCGSCAPMETVVECICCRECPAVARKQQGRQGCVTGHPDFEALCLNPGVLRLAYLNMRHYGQQGMGASAN
ncbi:hypothetical protein HPB47_014044, partial [Ixodes persulcatus]